MVGCLVSPHTRDETTKRWPRNVIVGPQIAIFTSTVQVGIGSNPYPKNLSQQIPTPPGAPSHGAVDGFSGGWDVGTAGQSR